MNKFKSGDKVVRIAETFAGYTVTKGKEYTVDYYGDDGSVHLVGINDWFNDENFELVESNTSAVNKPTTNKPIASDGGSSDYYKQPIPKGMLERWTAEGVIEAKDVMKLFLNNDYNFSNSFKAHCRVVSLRNGVGKEGASEAYDLRKGWFFAEDAYKDHLERSGE